MKIALFTSIQHSYITVLSEENAKWRTGVAQASEWVEVDFPPLKNADVVREQIHALDVVRAEVSRKFTEALKEIDDRKASLLALTYEPPK